MPEAARARAAAYVIATSEGATLHLPRLRTRPRDFDPDVRDRLIAGLADRQALRRMGERGAERARRLFTWDGVVDRMLPLITAVLPSDAVLARRGNPEVAKHRPAS